MAKSKKSRRLRREQTEKLRQRITSTLTSAQETAPAEISEAPGETTLETAQVTAGPRRRGVDFGHDYYYVYTEMRNILIVAIAMFAVMVGLSFFI
jgi:hypothetical protein